jgi:hypothetical protein
MGCVDARRTPPRGERRSGVLVVEDRESFESSSKSMRSPPGLRAVTPRLGPSALDERPVLRKEWSRERCRDIQRAAAGARIGVHNFFFHRSNLSLALISFT